jgi:hypothetical protein
MDFGVPAALSKELDGFKVFLNKHLKPNLSTWYKKGEVSLDFYNEMGKADWYGFRMEGQRLVKDSALRESLTFRPRLLNLPIFLRASRRPD